MNYFIFNTGGDWDSTTLYRNGDEFLADRLFLSLETGRDEFGNPRRGGLENGGEMSAYALPQGQDAEFALFPGKIDLEFPTHKVTIENNSPNFAIEFTRIWLDNVDVTLQMMELQVDINPVDNQVSAYLTLFKLKFLGADEVATYNLL